MPKLKEWIMFYYNHILAPRIPVRLCNSPRKPSKTSPEEQQASISRSEASNEIQEQNTAPKASQPESKQSTSGILSPYATAWTPANLSKISEHCSDYKETKKERSPYVRISDVGENFIQ